MRSSARKIAGRIGQLTMMAGLLAGLGHAAYAQDGTGVLQAITGAISDAPEGSDARATLSGRILQLMCRAAELFHRHDI